MEIFFSMFFGDRSGSGEEGCSVKVIAAVELLASLPLHTKNLHPPNRQGNGLQGNQKKGKRNLLCSVTGSNCRPLDILNVLTSRS